MTQNQDINSLISLFNHLFLKSENTELVCGKEEPLYLPADNHYPHHRIIFAHGFFSSALHEIAHWCVAGSERRLLEDYGYWYKPDGRTSQEQQLFEKVEVRPQAYEWILAQCARAPFHFSADNLSQGVGASIQFKQQVSATAQTYLKTSNNPRLNRLIEALCEQYQTSRPEPEQFNVSCEFL